MKRPPPIAARPSVAARFRTEIERAAAEGVDLGDMALHLTLGDVELLKRDRALPVADISFHGGAMSYLGVKVVKGNVPASELRRLVAESP
jgi:hypothetical protein